MEERDWSTFAGPNPDCPAYGKRGQNNLRPHGWSSKPRNIRCLRCTTRGRHFSARAGTPLFRTEGTAWEAFLDFYERTDGCLPELVTTDAYAPYLSVLVS